jgi:hypothetical protein
MRLRAIQTPADGTEACLERLLRRGRHAVAGAGSLEPLGGLKSWPTSLEATPRPQTNCVARQRVLNAYRGKTSHAGAWSEEP